MQALETRVPPPVWAASCGGLMWLLARMLPLAIIIPAPARWVGLGIGLAGFALDVWCILFFRRARTTVNPLTPQRSSALVIAGPFSFSRNPMYLGMLLWLTGWAFFLRALSPFFVLPLFVVLLTRFQIIPEERALRKIFAAEFDAYSQRVPRWLGLRRNAATA